MMTFQVRGGQYGKNIKSRFFLNIYIYIYMYITILCHFGFTILTEQYSQTNFPIIKTKPFKVTKLLRPITTLRLINPNNQLKDTGRTY